MSEFVVWSMADTWKLLAAIQAFDDRNFQEAHALSWNAMANQGRWPRDLAIEAVRYHFLNSTETLLPAHVHEYVRSRKEDQAMREFERTGPPDLKVAKFIERNWRSDKDLELSLLEVACPFEGCRASPSQPCFLGGYLAGRHKRYQPHPGRHYVLAELARANDLDPSYEGPECPTCGAPPGLRCMNLGRGCYLSARTNPHPDRLRVAA